MKKFMSTLLAATMVLSLAACSEKSSAPAAKESAPASSTAGTSASAAAQADTYPKGPVTITVLAGAGGVYDTGVRLLVPFVEKELGTTINVINNDGGGGWVQWNECLQANPDGYNLYTTNFPAFFSCYNPDMGYATRIDDFEFIAQNVTDPCVLFTPKDSPVQTLEQFLDYCKKSTDAVVIGVTVAAGDDHIAYCQMVNAVPELQKTTVALNVNSFSETKANLLGGFCEFMIGNVGDIKKTVDDCNVICVFNDERSKMYPDIPTFNELANGLGINASVISGANRGIIMPKGGDPAVVAKIRDAFKKALANPELVKAYTDAGLSVCDLVGEDYRANAMKLDTNFQNVLYLLGWDKK
ncbi:hypothetical protein CE91St46_30120 [Eubacteriales bacterium]|nr:tripartite tricarboxylate transporter substrate binding protein [Faecalicatena sp. BF-R-105]GKH51901.1 hypothetical protein CE91St46_30120 [Eubacteriales bacterium]GKH64621.1 hypothetical protein CE91St47_30900 [Eubacteriales bacterium]